MALDLASAVATHLSGGFSQPGGQARRLATGKGAHPGAPGLGGCDRGHTILKYAFIPRGSTRGRPLLFRMQWVQRLATAGYPLRFHCNGWNATNRHE